MRKPRKKLFECMNELYDLIHFEEEESYTLVEIQQDIEELYKNFEITDGLELLQIAFILHVFGFVPEKRYTCFTPNGELEEDEKQKVYYIKRIVKR